MKLDKVFTALIITFPILFLYATPIQKVSVADILLIILCPILIIELIRRKKIIIKKSFKFIIIFLIYVLLQSIIMCMVNGRIDNSFFSAGRIILFLGTIVILGPNFYIPRLGKKIYKLVCVFSTIYLFIQIAVYKLFNFYLAGTIPGLPLLREELKIFNENFYVFQCDPRPRSIFTEPAHYATYVSFYLILSLFSKEKKDYISIIIVTSGLIVSNSATGFLSLIFIYFAWIIYMIRRDIGRKVLLKNICEIVIGGTAVISVVLLTSNFRVFLFRVFGTNANSFGTATIGRFSNYLWAFSTKGISISELIFGRGMIDMTKYIPVFPMIFYYFGLFGMMLLGVSLINIYINNNIKKKMILLLIIISSIGGEAMSGPIGLFSFIFFISSKNKLDKGENKNENSTGNNYIRYRWSRETCS